MRTQKSTFSKLYTALNSRQREAVDAIEGPVIVIAGPGTGKTQVLTLRIANILKETDVGPEAILALTFTQSAVATMRARLAEIVGSAAYRVHMYTFHGFANSIIKRYPEYFPRIIGSRTADRIDSLRIVEQAVLTRRLKAIKPFGNPLYYVSSIVRAIETLKRENISPSVFAALLRAEERTLKQGVPKGIRASAWASRLKRHERNRELILVYRAYEETLKRERLYDYGDMIMEVVRVLSEEKDLLLSLQEEYIYILADEHQDANQAQNKILELLGSFHENPNLFIVGDEKQAIYQFQGASLDNFLYFTKRFPTAKIIELSDNYRSTQTILDAAHSLANAAPPDSRLSTARLTAKKMKGEDPISLLSIPRGDEEPKYIAGKIKALITHGVPAEEIAVLYRDNGDMAPFASALATEGIETLISSDTDVLDDPALKELLILLYGAEYMDEDKRLAELLCLPLTQVPAHIRYALYAYAADAKMPLYRVLAHADQVTTLREEEVKEALHFSRKLSQMNAIAHTYALPASVDWLINKSGYREAVLTSTTDASATLERLSSFFAELKHYAERYPNHKLKEFLEYITAIQNHGLSIPERTVGKRGVRLMTMHRSKGLEFDVVFIVRAFHGHVGGRASRERFDLPLRGSALGERIGVDDERRLFYVALTRARKQALLSYSSSAEDGTALLPTQFVSELDQLYLASSQVILKKEKNKTLAPLSYTIRPAHTVPDREYLRTLFLERGFSVTHLNNYRSCPWKYFFVNLLRIPEAKSKHLIYGSAIHAALKELYGSVGRGGKISLTRVVHVFEELVAQAPILPIEREELLAKGRAALRGYVQTHQGALPKEVRTEYAVRGIPFPIDGKDVVRLNGVLDRITLLPDGTVLVSDYKTGHYKTHNELLGKTKNADGNYWRQLVFYKLLLDTQGVFTMKDGEIVFVEPDEKGRYRSERFTITLEDVEILKTELTTVLNDIATLAFWDRGCSDPDCEYCTLAQLMKK